MIVKIDVTEEDIDGGTNGDCEFCPVALAITRLVKYQPSVSDDGLSFDDSEISGYIVLPSSVDKFIGDFDNDFLESCKPFSFDIDIPEELLK